MKRFFLITLILFVSMLMFRCTEDNDREKLSWNEGVEYSPEKDARIQQYNLEQQKKFAAKRTPCDTLALKEFILNTYPEGSYLIDCDKTLSYSIPRTAVIYYQKSKNYIFGVVVKSHEGERLIEPKNIIGYDQSFVDLDSTELGTAYFYLTLFLCGNGNFEKIWETLVPSHGGFNKISLKIWKYKNTPFVELNFHYGRGTGHINYNYFLIDDTEKIPHLLMTYEGINFKRTMANINNDKYPDYYEHIYYDLGNRVFSPDSVAFVWNEKESLYVNSRNQKQKRPY